MPVVAIQGLRGGCGCTSIVAGLAGALRQLDRRVLAFDFCPDNMLGVHLGLALEETDGWAPASMKGGSWLDVVFSGLAGIVFVPYGERVSKPLSAAVEDAMAGEGGSLADVLTEAQYSQDDWVLLDLPGRLSEEVVCAIGSVDLFLQIAEADGGCHVLMQRAEQDQNPKWRPDAAVKRILVNRFQASLVLQRDLWLVWRQRLGKRLLPFNVHRDEHLPEALACRNTIQQYRPDSQFSRDMLSLATWCVTDYALSSKAK